MAGLGIYCMGGYGRIGVYRVNYVSILAEGETGAIKSPLHLHCILHTKKEKGGGGIPDSM